jgi:hypothetical protein
LRVIAESCPVDGTPHNFLPVPEKPGWVYCTKCLTSMELTFNPEPPDPPDPPDPEPPDPRPVRVYQANGTDDTAALQSWLNQQPNDSIYDIQGTAAINSQGVRVLGKVRVKITSSNGGGFKAISNGPYTSPFSAMVYAEGFNESEFNGLKFNSNSKQAMGIFLLKSTRGKVLKCESWGVAQNPNGAPWAGIYGEQCTETEIGYCHVHDTAPTVRGIWLGVGDRRDSKPHIHHCKVERTGHTGIITEANGPYVHDNEVYDIPQHGTGYKFIPRGPADAAMWENNLVSGTGNAGFMMEGSTTDPPIEIRNHTFKNCGADNTTFGGFYLVNGQGNTNLNIHDCSFENCRRLGAMQYVTNSQFRNMTIKSSSDLWSLELNNANLMFQNAGKVEMGQGNSDINVQGAPAPQQMQGPIVDYDKAVKIALLIRLIGL